MDQLQPKAVLFDMDGVLIDSMPVHVLTWQTLYKRYGINVADERIYMDEGRVGVSNIANIFAEEKGQKLSTKECKALYEEKTAEVRKAAVPGVIADMPDFLAMVRQCGCATSVVTGSGQMTLLAKLDKYYPQGFDHEKMVTALDVTQGKPHPEPYLKGLAKHDIKPSEAIVIENAPLGVAAAKAAGIFVLAINTGPLPNSILADEGADVVVNSAKELMEWWQNNIKKN